MTPLLYCAALDDRYGQNQITSRIGLTESAQPFDKNTEFFKDIESQNNKAIACVLVDEAQFLNRSQVEQLARVVDELNIPVLCYGIRTDFRGELFEGSQRLLALADKLKELKTVCSCGKKATMVVRLGDDGKPMSEGAQVEIGGNDRYESRCRKHFYAAVNTNAAID